MELQMKDISQETYGKYQYCTGGKDGLMYSDDDFEYGAGCGDLKKGALPSPWQSTPELTAKAKVIRDKAENEEPVDFPFDH